MCHYGTNHCKRLASYMANTAHIHYMFIYMQLHVVLIPCGRLSVMMLSVSGPNDCSEEREHPGVRETEENGGNQEKKMSGRESRRRMGGAQRNGRTKAGRGGGQNWEGKWRGRGRMKRENDTKEMVVYWARPFLAAQKVMGGAKRKARGLITFHDLLINHISNQLLLRVGIWSSTATIAST